MVSAESINHRSAKPVQVLEREASTHQIPVHHTSRVNVFEPTQDLVQKVLDELLFERARCEETMQVCTEEFGDKVNVF
jgi:hypothetical protein